MQKLEFRALRADEVECRIGTCSEKGVSLLLYKDARCDMRVLDETVGPMNWQRVHTRDNANCTVMLWDAEKGQWISKEDTGTESNTEAEKGLASDSFKRACTNWGIGRELYTSPFIWVPAGKANIYDTGRKDKYGKPVFGCKTRFFVSHMRVEDGRIDALQISDGKEIVFSSGKIPADEDPMSGAQLQEIMSITDREQRDKLRQKFGPTDKWPAALADSLIKQLKERQNNA